MNDVDKKWLGCLAIVCMIIVGFIIGYFVLAALTYIIAYCFGFDWNWLVPLGIMCFIIVLRIIVQRIF